MIIRPNVAANVAALKVKRLFIDVPKESSMRFRILPTLNSEGEIDFELPIFTGAANHFRLNDEDGQGRAYACLKQHGTEETGTDCFFCTFAHTVAKYGADKKEKAIGGNKNGISRSRSYYLQVLTAEKGNDGWTYSGPNLLRVPQSGADAVQAIMVQQEINDEVPFLDIEGGHDISIEHLTKNPWYRAFTVSNHCSIESVFPDFRTKMISDVYEELNLRILTPEEQKATAQRTYPNEIDWQRLADDFGL